MILSEKYFRPATLEETLSNIGLYSQSKDWYRTHPRQYALTECIFTEQQLPKITEETVKRLRIVKLIEE